MKVFVSALLGIARGKSEPACLPNSSWNECGSACPRVCGVKTADVCIAVCVPKCVCDPGYILNDDGMCISEADCENGEVTISPIDCPGNQVYQSACCSTLGCFDDFPVLCVDLRPGESCPMMCVCPNEQVWDDFNQLCVDESECPKCPSNQVFEEACCSIENCDENEPQMCALPPPGGSCPELCVCPAGLKWNGKECVAECREPEECPVGLEMQRTCCSQPTCDNEAVLCHAIEEGGQCPEMCVCEDQRLFYDKKSQTCVSPEECPTMCGENEIWNECGSACPKVCGQPPADFCIEMCISGCECASGFIRDGKSGICIPEDKCDAGSKKCPKNEVWSNCDRTCEDTCENPEFSQVCRPFACGEAMCTCAKGFARHRDGKCLSKRQCKSQIEAQEILEFAQDLFPGLDEGKTCDPSTLPFASRYNFKKRPVKPGKNIKLTCKDAKKNPKKKKFVKCKIAKDENGDKLGAYFQFGGDIQNFYDDCADGCSLEQKQVVQLFGSTLVTDCSESGPESKCRFSCTTMDGAVIGPQKPAKCSCKTKKGKRVCAWKFDKKDSFIKAQMGKNPGNKCMT